MSKNWLDPKTKPPQREVEHVQIGDALGSFLMDYLL